MLRTFCSALILCALATGALARTKLKMQDCGSPAVSSATVYMEDDEITRGSEVRVTATGIANRDVSGGTYDVVVKRRAFRRFVPFYTENGDFCEILGFKDSCEFHAGEEVNIQYSRVVPLFFVRGFYSAVIRASDLEGAPLICFVVQMPLKGETDYLPA